MTQVEKNIVIAKFMGGNICLNEGKIIILLFPDDKMYDNNQLAYHSSWDWLMPVIQKLFKYDVIFQVSELEVKSAICYEQIEEVHQLVYHWITKINKINEENK